MLDANVVLPEMENISNENSSATFLIAERIMKVCEKLKCENRVDLIKSTGLMLYECMTDIIAKYCALNLLENKFASEEEASLFAEHVSSLINSMMTTFSLVYANGKILVFKKA